jgi:hypothetical protein
MYNDTKGFDRRNKKRLAEDQKQLKERFTF